MQTFLPYSHFIDVAKCLDYKRLGKQRVEAMQIHRIISGQSGKSTGWVNHPAVIMWRGYPEALAHYHNCMIAEWVGRGYKNTMSFIPPGGTIQYPHWLGYEPFHASHRSNLLRKDAEYYGQFNWKEPDDLEYIWPTDFDVKGTRPRGELL